MKKIEIILRDLIKQKRLMLEIIIVGGTLFSYLLYLLFFSGRPTGPLVYLLGWPIALAAIALFFFRPLLALKIVLFVFVADFTLKISFLGAVPLATIRFTFPEITSILLLIALVPRYFLKLMPQDLPLSKCFKIFYAASLVPILIGMRSWGFEHAMRDSTPVYYTVFYFVTGFLVTRIEEVRSLVKWFIAATVIIAIVSIRVLILRGSSFGGAAAMMYFSCVVYLLIALLQGGYLNKKKFAVILIVCYLIILFTARTRGGFFSFIGGAMLLLSFSKFKHKLILFITLFLVVSALLFSYQQGMFGGKRKLDEMVERRIMAAANMEGDLTGRQRLIRWRIGWKHFLDYPVVGNGYGFGYWEPGYGGKYVEYLGSSLHNSYLHILMSSGVVGFLGFLTIIFAIFQKCLKNIFSLNPTRRIIAIIILSSFVNFLITCWSNTALEVAYIGGVGWIWLALGMRVLQMNDEELNSLVSQEKKV